MKKLYFTLAFVCFSLFVSAQCMVQVACQPATCFGNCDGSAIAYANGVPPFTYSWAPGGQTTQTINGLCAGIYVCTMTDSLGCVATASCTVTQPAQLQAIITSSVSASCQTCCDGSATGNATGGNPPYIGLWSGPNGFTATGFQISNLCIGTYTFCVTDANGCTSCTSVNISYPTGLAAQQSENFGMNVAFITPGTLNVTANFGAATSGTIVVTNTLGQDVYRESFQGSAVLQREIDLNGQGSGLYFVTITTDDGRQTRKILKN